VRGGTDRSGATPSPAEDVAPAETDDSRAKPTDALEEGVIQHISNTVTSALLAYVKKVGGDALIDEVLMKAGENRPVSELTNPGRWSVYDDALNLFLAASDVLDDPNVGARAAESLFENGAETVEMMRSVGSPTELFKLTPYIMAKQSTITDAEAVEVGRDFALIAATTRPPFVRHPLFCGYSMSAYSQYPILFGMNTIEAEEIECQTRGDSRCLYRIVWDPMQTEVVTPEQKIERLEQRVAVLSTRFESFEAMASELASATASAAAPVTCSR